MYPSTKQYLKRQIVKLIEQTNDTEHENGSVTIWDIQHIIDGMKGYHDVDEYYKE